MQDADQSTVSIGSSKILTPLPPSTSFPETEGHIMTVFTWRLIVSVLLVFGSIQGGFADARAAESNRFTFTTFNVRWYGLGGDLNRPKKEYRDPWLAQFLFTATPAGRADVIAFQEIVDVDGLKRLMKNHACSSYDHKDPRHQHVVLCVRRGLRLTIERFDDNFAIESVALGRLRPALHGLVVTDAGQPVAHVIAVHLKAQIEQTETRMRQVRLLREHVDRYLADRVPVVIMGDFNTHIKERTHQGQDDTDLFDDELNRSTRKLRHLANPNRSTFKTPQAASVLDHVWVSDHVSLIGTPAVHGACNSDGRKSNDFSNLDFYNRNISDHCPVTAELEFN